MSDVAIYRLTHKQLKQSGIRFFVEVPLRMSTVDDLDSYDPDTPVYRRAAIAVCGKFRIYAGKKYFDGDWPADHELTLDVLEIQPVELIAKKKHPPSSQQRAKYV